MSAEEFVTAYKTALGTQQWKNVEPLIHENACVTFSNGAVNKGLAEIKTAYEYNFSVIKSEDYQMSNLHWALKNETVAVYLFDFSWKGIINGTPSSGCGKGTAVIVCESKNWKLLAEQLTKA